MITIEPISEAHIPLVQKFASHPSIGTTSTVPSPYPVDGASLWYQQVSSKIAAGVSVVYAINCGGEFCGVMSLNGIDQQNNTAEIDYWVAHEFQGRGIATAAAQQATLSAHRSLGITMFFSTCLKRNLPSNRVLEKIGFKKISEAVLEHGKHKGECVQRFQLHFLDGGVTQQVAQTDGPASGGPAA